MIDYQAPLRDMRFVLYEVFNVADDWARWESLSELVDQETADAILEEGAKLVSKTLSPLYRTGDEQGCHWQDGKVSTPSGFKEAYQLYSEGGWTGLSGNPEYGGMGMPKSLGAQFDEMSCGANLALMLYPSLTSGAALAIDAHASEAIKSLYLPKMYSGEWAGTMCLTEPHSGTDLGIIRTKAIPEDDGSYSLTGTKIFITGGEHDLSDNIVHLVLAKLPGAPAGPKGISLFLVPKVLVNDDGSLTEPNSVSCGSIEHKMGIKGASTCVMNFDGAKGYLVGDLNKGLNCMFTMMNYERLFVGIQGLGSAERSYQNALAYAKDRLQGRAATGVAYPDKEADPLMVHGDIRRTLMNIKALNEGGRAFSTFVGQQLDKAKFGEAYEKQKAAGLVALLTPVAKAFFTDMGLECCVAGQQVLGGHGYIAEWGQEQLVRDVRITQIYEGTNGIQSLDLLGRKIAANEGAYFRLFADEVRVFIGNAENSEFAPALSKALDELEQATEALLKQTADDPNTINAACVEYLQGFAYVAYGWVWAQMAEVAKAQLDSGTDDQDFYQAKVTTARYFYKRQLPKGSALLKAAVSGAEELYGLSNEQF
ncbi:acyl-CoA dehydrogenase [Endozoicomonas montiporae]|uniref:3-methylmercaptopropionyl-CoA dehydrogenase n=2 Tax=Endozoicomonas montiporae TaxID=1027273 RepID=A0A081N2J4_9GAMM|nr:acyl-CoA dehydrogenase C-terminal domain-containing protein [Endozoicomonas montiporae]AMO54789.1 acyl-CoA dehydrogenase domain-containing protein [Endozoicomonas montiporae CL-33]KEQ12667.1 acyl-CoA dehydrogenase [Endozoicomonas montiporae]